MASTPPIIDKYAGFDQTVGAVASTLVTIPTVTNSVMCVRAVVLGQRASNGDAFAVESLSILNNDSGTLTEINQINQVGPGGQIFTDGGNFDIAAVSPNIEIQVLGVAAATIDWVCYIEVIRNNT
jgi:hypothetical protein